MGLFALNAMREFRRPARTDAAGAGSRSSPTRTAWAGIAR